MSKYGRKKSRTSKKPFEGCYNRSYYDKRGRLHSCYVTNSSFGTKSGWNGAVIFALGIFWGDACSVPVGLGIYIVAYGILGYDVVLGAVRNIVKGHVFDENFLMSLSSIGAFFIG